jgi:hypothetical protein
MDNPFRRSIDSVLFSQFGEDAFKSFQRVVGADFVQDQTARIASSWLFPSHYSKSTEFEKTQAVGMLSQITQLNAYRLLYTLPCSVLEYASESLTPTDIESDQRRWEGIAAWLLHWKNGGGRGKCFEIVNHFYASYKQDARVSELRFDFIRELVEQKQFFPEAFQKPSCPWLLSEIAIARRRLQNAGNPGTKQEHYKKVAAYLEWAASPEVRTFNLDILSIESQMLGDPFELTRSFDVMLDDLLLHFDRIVEERARQYASENDVFCYQYWKPYLSAASVLNVSNRRNPKRQIFGADKTQRRRKPKQSSK